MPSEPLRRPAAFITMSAPPSSPSPDGPHLSPARPPPRPRVLAAAKLTRLLTSAAVGGTLLLCHDTTALLAVVGGLGNAALTNGLKRVLNAPRPDSPAARTKSSSGMPSSHASNLAFFGALAVQTTGRPEAWAALALAAVAASWRVGAGFHTWAQVVVGFVWGAGLAAAWARIVQPRLVGGVDGVMVQYGEWWVTLVVAAVGVVAVFGRDLWMVREKRRVGE